MTDVVKKVNDREVVLQILLEVLEKGEYSHLVMKNVLDKYAFLEKQDRSFINRLSDGTIERKLELDYIINQFSKTKVNKMKPMIRTILRMAVYQIFYMDAVPDTAACNEAVKLAQKHSFSSLKGFVNGVLRNIVRQKDAISYPDFKKEPVKALSVKYSMPEWIVSMWLSRFGEEKTQDILKGLLQKRPLTVRMDGISKEEAQKLRQEILQSGIQLTQSKELAYAYFVEGFDRVEQVPGFLDGSLMVQDLGSMLITEAAEIKPGDHIIDVCGAPGGKALHAACKTGKSGSVDVRDVTEYKISLIRENIERSGAGNIQAKVWDATVLEKAAIECGDVVIADLPCSGLGVIGRKSDIKYRVKPEDVTEIAALQRQILTVVQEYVKTGGVLLYSTCTITEAENEENVAWFQEHFPFELEYSRLLLPGSENETDGFFLARFRKKG